MSKASDTFAEAIMDAENLLRHFNTLNLKPPPPELEVLKRAGLIMAMTAWETYVEDRLEEATAERLEGLTDRSIVEFVESRLAEEIKRLHNPDSGKTIRLFRDYVDVDLEICWCWNNFDFKTVRKRLDTYIRLRGDVVHRSRPAEQGAPKSHLVRKVDLEKAISFLKNLVEATERGLLAICR
ncbi:MAG: HEPN domain-containing protein [Pseudomonadales bacterium]